MPDAYDQGPRRFKPPWNIKEGSESFIVRDTSGVAIAYVYISDDPERRSHMGRLTRDEGRRIANGIARLPELLVNKSD